MNTETTVDTMTATATAPVVKHPAIQDLEAARKFSSSVFAAVLTAREVTYCMVAMQLKMAECFYADPDYAAQILALAGQYNVPVPKIQEGETPFLMIVKLSDGQLVPRKNKKGDQLFEKDGSPTMEWKHNRSGEKYAGPIGFCYLNGISSDNLVAFLKGSSPMTVNGEAIKPTLHSLILAASKFFNAKTRKRTTVWTEDAKAKASKLKPLAEVPFEGALKEAVVPGEDGFAIAVVRVVNGKLQVIGDTGLRGNEILKFVADRSEAFIRFMEQHTEEEEEEAA